LKKRKEKKKGKKKKNVWKVAQKEVVRVKGRIRLIGQ